MTINEIFIGYVSVALGALSLIGIYYERRQKRFGPTPSADHIFRCGTCGFVYTDDADVDRSRCSQCGALNDAIKF